MPFLFANLELLMRFAAKPSGNEHTLHIRTTDPKKDYELILTNDSVALGEVDEHEKVDLELPAEAFLRLAYADWTRHTRPRASIPPTSTNCVESFRGSRP